MRTHDCLKVLVKIDGKEIRPTNRLELEAALGGKAVPDLMFTQDCQRDEDWSSSDCLCLLDPGATAHETGFVCEPNYADGKTDICFISPV